MQYSQPPMVPTPSWRRIAGPFLITSDSDGSQKGYKLSATNGGHLVKTFLYMVKVHQSSSSNAKVGLNLDHGPDGQIYTSFGTLITATAITSPPQLLVGASGTPDTDAADNVGEWVVPVVTIEDATATSMVSAVVEIWEMRKNV